MDLYHYTSIESLLSIIISKKIKFNRLDNLEDLTDGNIPVKVIPNINQCINSTYIACFTQTSEEKYPLWKMYNATQ
jgi:hypothetical protein